MSVHTGNCQCSGRPAVHPRHNAQALRQPRNPWQSSVAKKNAGACRHRTSAHSGAHNLVQASSQPVLAPRFVCSSASSCAPQLRSPNLTCCSRSICGLQDARNGRGSYGHAATSAYCIFGWRGKRLRLLCEQECCSRIRLADVTFCIQVNDFNADAIISQLLLLDSTDPTKVRPATTCHMS